MGTHRDGIGQFIKNQTQRIYIATVVNHLSISLFRGPVGGRSLQEILSVILFPCNSQIAKAVIIMIQKNVLRFDILMDDTVLMHDNKGIAKIDTDGKDFFKIFRLFFWRSLLLQMISFQFICKTFYEWHLKCIVYPNPVESAAFPWQNVRFCSKKDKINRAAAGVRALDAVYAP